MNKKRLGIFICTILALITLVSVFAKDSVNNMNLGLDLKGGFEMGNIWYNEPKTLEVAFDVIGDIVMAAASQQYGGFTVPEVDKILAPYAQKTYDKNYKKILNKIF